MSAPFSGASAATVRVPPMPKKGAHTGDTVLQHSSSRDRLRTPSPSLLPACGLVIVAAMPHTYQASTLKTE
jgi:hypothetical protein